MPEASEAAASTPAYAVELLPITLLDESPTNPRRHFDAAALAELVDDVKRNGVLQPLLVREKPAKGRRRFEVVLGHRRLRASMKAGLEWLPCIVRELTEEQAFELQLAELHKHADVHYLDEAESYARSRDKFGHSVEEIAAQIGKSTRVVYQRLQLLHLRPEAREAAVAEEWSASIAQLVATVTNHDEQGRLLKALRKGAGSDSRYVFRGDKEPPTYRGVLDLLRQDFRLALKDAPWQLDNADLVPAAGPCTTCPKRTGNQPELFGEPKDRADVCTDPPCFRSKCEAVWAQRVAAAEAKGQTVLSPAAAKKLFDTSRYSGSHLRYNAGYVDVAEKRRIGSDFRTPRGALRNDLPPTVLARAPDGQIVELVPEKALNAALRSAGLVKKQPADRRKPKSGPTSADLRRDAIARFRALVASHIRQRAAEAAENVIVDETPLWRFLAAVLLKTVDYEALEGIEQRRGLAAPAPKRRGYVPVGARTGIERLLLTATDSAARGIAVELALGEEIYHGYGYGKSPYGTWLPRAAEIFGIDVEQLEADVAAYLVAAAPPAKPAKTKRKPKVRAKKKAAAKGKGAPKKKPARKRKTNGNDALDKKLDELAEPDGRDLDDVYDAGDEAFA